MADLIEAEIAELRRLHRAADESRSPLHGVTMRTEEMSLAVLVRERLPRLLDEVDRARRARAMLPPVARGDRVSLDRRDYDEIRRLLGAK